MQEIKFTTIRTSKGQFVVVKKEDKDKYFLEYLEDESKQGKQGKECKVGYLVKECGQFYLQEAFFDKLNFEHVLFRSVVKTDDPIIRKDLMDNLFAACYQIEKAINNKGKKSATYMVGATKRKWSSIIQALQDGSDLETAVCTCKINNDVEF